jgi:hypothetical protein
MAMKYLTAREAIRLQVVFCLMMLTTAIVSLWQVGDGWRYIVLFGLCGVPLVAVAILSFAALEWMARRAGRPLVDRDEWAKRYAEVSSAPIVVMTNFFTMGFIVGGGGHSGALGPREWARRVFAGALVGVMMVAAMAASKGVRRVWTRLGRLWEARE